MANIFGTGAPVQSSGSPAFNGAPSEFNAKVTCSSANNITAVRFYVPDNSDFGIPAKVQVYFDGVALVKNETSFTVQSTIGWQSVTLSTPVAVP